PEPEGERAGVCSRLRDSLSKSSRALTEQLAVAAFDPAVALGERPSRRQIVGVTLAVVGIAAIAAGRAQAVPLEAVALGIASAAAWGCGNVVTRAARPKRPFSLLVWSSVVAPVPLLGLSLIFEGTARWQSAASSINASGIAALAYVVVVSTLLR